MTEPTIIGNATLYHGDCIDLLRTLPDNSIEACLTDPPYGLSNHAEADIRACMTAWLAGKPYQHGKAGFMGKSWDSFVPGPEMWKELYRVLKPGAHLLVFAGTRTADLMSLALRLAGFECRDCVMFCFGSGFPKAADVSKMIDAHFCNKRERIGSKLELGIWNGKKGQPGQNEGWKRPWMDNPDSDAYHVTAPASPEAAQWDGWKSSLKPSYEPILLFRKPLDGTIAETVLKWGCGGLNISACRVEANDGNNRSRDNSKCKTSDSFFKGKNRVNQVIPENIGRYPGNLIVSSDEEVERCFPVTSNSFRPSGSRLGHKIKGIFNNGLIRDGDVYGHNDSGSASRFFQHCDYSVEEIAEMNGIELKRIVYSGKASKRDRDEGCDGFEKVAAGGMSGRHDGSMGSITLSRNTHSTVKPTSLLRYLLRMITPPGATVIDPFFGSGSTGKAALLEGFNVIGIEREAEYFEIAKARCAYVAPEVMIVKPSSSESAQRQEKLF